MYKVGRNSPVWHVRSLFALYPLQSYEPPSGALGEAINNTWGSFEAFQDAVTATAAGLQGSGWVWLGLDPETGTLSIQTTANQDTLQSKYGLTPLLGIDLWEHSYVRWCCVVLSGRSFVHLLRCTRL